MKYIRKFEEVEAVQFLWGVPENEEGIIKFAKTSEVKACIEKRPGGRIWMEIKKDGCKFELENKDFLVWADGRLCAIKEADFLKAYEEFRPPRLELMENDKGVSFKRVTSGFYVDVLQLLNIKFITLQRGFAERYTAVFTFKNGSTETLSANGESVMNEIKKFIEKELL